MMTESELKRESEKAVEEATLPLVLEIIPGQAGAGLIDIYEAGTYSGKTLKELCDKTLGKEEWSIEDHQVVEDIRRQLKGGILLCRGRQISGLARDYAKLEETEAGERYFYVAVRALKPQEGGKEKGKRKK